MTNTRSRLATCLGLFLFAMATLGGDQLLSAQDSKLDVEGKVVLANVDRYPMKFRIGSVEKQIEPGKASVLSPKQLPLTVELWNNVPGLTGWERQEVTSAGSYTVQFKLGRWTLTELPPRPAALPAPVALPFRPTYLRTTGPAPRIEWGDGMTPYGGGIPFLRRVAWDVLGLFQVVENEADRALIRQVLMSDDVDRETKQGLVERLDQLAADLPYYERRDFQRAFRDLNSLTDRDLANLRSATVEDWNQVRNTLGARVTDDAWQALQAGFGDTADTGDVPEANDTDAAELEAANLSAMLNNVDISDLGGDFETLNLGTYRAYEYWGFRRFRRLRQVEWRLGGRRLGRVRL